MKSVVIVLIMSAVMLAGGIFYMNRINDVSEEFIRINGEIKEAVLNNRFDTASDKVDEIYEYMDRKERYFETFSDHEELDKIEMNLAELDEYIKANYKAEAAAKTNVLDFLFKHLPQNYKLKVENIF